MRLATLLLLAILARASPAAAGEMAVDCNDIRNTHESNVCAERDFQAADASLNEVYKRVLAHIAENGGDKPYDSRTWSEAMKASQRAWVAFRDADCKGVVPIEWSGGTGTSAAVLGCMTSKTKERIRELEDRYAAR